MLPWSSFLLHSFRPPISSSSSSSPFFHPTLQHLNVEHEGKKDSRLIPQRLSEPPRFLPFYLGPYHFSSERKNKEIRNIRRKKKNKKWKFFEHTKPDSSINFTVFIFFRVCECIVFVISALFPAYHIKMPGGEMPNHAECAHSFCILGCRKSSRRLRIVS